MADSSSELQIKITARDEATAALTQLQTAMAGLQREQEALTKALADATLSANAYIEADSRLGAVSKELAAVQGQVAEATKTAATTAKEATTAQKDHDAALKAAGASAKDGGISFGQLAGSMTVATLAAEEIKKVVGELSQYLTDSIKVATDYQSALIGVRSVGAELGQSTDKVNAAIQALTKDGLLNAQQAANDLRNVMQRGFDVDQATQAVQAMKEFAAFGKKGQEDLGAAVDSATLGWRHQRSVMMENAGFLHTFQEVWKEYAAEQGKGVNMLTEQDKRQAELNAVLRQGAVAAGDAAKFTQTYAGQQEVLANKTLDVQAAVGEALMPAVTYLRQGWQAFMQQIGQFITDHGPALQQLFFDTAKVLATFAQEVILVGRLIASLFDDIAAGSFQPTVDAWNQGMKSISDAASTSFASVKGAAIDSAHTMTQEAINAANARTEAEKKAGQQITDEYAKENQRYADLIAQRQQTFADSLQRMIQAHQDKVAQVKGQLADEQASYAASVQQRQDTYNEQVASLEDSHLQKVTDITQQISDEKAKGIYIDGVLFSQGDQKKLEKLQDSLEKEQAAYDKRKQQLADKYADEVKVAQAAYDKKQEALQDSLSKEQAILDAHAKEVGQMSARVAEDDITILERKFAEENAKEVQHHTEALAAINQRSIEKGVATGTGMATGLAQATPAAVAQAAKMGEEIGKSLSDSLNSSMKQSSKGGFLEKLAESISLLQSNPGGVLQAAGAAAGDLGKAILNTDKSFWGSVASSLGGLFKASGGPVAAGQPYIVGEQGPELMIPSGGGTIIPAGQTQQMLGHGGGVHIENFHNYSPTDLAAFAREMAWRLN